MICEIDKQKVYIASPSQTRMYAIQSINPDSITYNMPMGYIVKGNLEISKLESSIQYVIQSHPALRSNFIIQDNKVVQIIQDDVKLSLSLVKVARQDLSAMVNKFIRPFDIGSDCLFRVNVFEIGKEEYLLIFDMHHIISDGVSVRIILKEIADTYNNENTFQCEDGYITSIQKYDTEEWPLTVKKHEQFWLEMFKSGHEQLIIPTEYARPSIQTFIGSVENFQIDHHILESAIKLCKQSKATMYMLFLSCFKILLAKYCRQENVTVGTITSGREDVHEEKTVGLFAKTFALRSNPGGNKIFYSFLNEVKNTVYGMFENCNYPYESLLDALELNRELDKNPLFDILFLFQNIGQQSLSLSGCDVSRYNFNDRNVSALDLTFGISNASDSISIQIEYRTDLFSSKWIRNFGAHFINILTQIVENPFKKICEYTLLTKTERTDILQLGTSVGAYDNVGIIESIDLFAEKNPGKTALRCANSTLTYAEMIRIVNSIAFQLRNRGIGENDVVCVCMEPSLELILAILACVRAGATYLPVDVNYPSQRIGQMLDNSNAKIALVSKTSEKLIENLGILIIDTNELLHLPTINTSWGKRNENSDFYIIFTSGSTGTPKGAAVHYGSELNLLHWYIHDLGITESDVFIICSSIGFDLTQKNLFAPLMTGASIVISDSLIFDSQLLNRTIAKHQVTWINCAPAIFYSLIDNDDRDYLKSLRMVVLGGEKITLSRLRKWLSLHTGSTLVNSYGPTECTDVVCYYTVNENDQNDSIPIGKPINNAEIYILGNYDELLPVGVQGELCIGGICVSDGYIGDTELTKRKFVNNPFDRSNKIYKTGDLAKWLENGNVEYVDRIDNQVKIRGYRIEPGEIESVLKTYHNVENAAVIVSTDNNDDRMLIGFIAAEKKVDITKLREFLKDRLPAYMVPSHLKQLKRLPFTPHGKLDKKALVKELDNIKSTELVLPRNYTEEKLHIIWKEILNTSDFGVEDSFFNTGGHSLKAIAMISKIRVCFGVELSVRDIFDSPTIEKIASLIGLRAQCNNGEIPKADRLSAYPVTPPQKRIYALMEIEKGTGYNISLGYKIYGQLQKDRLERACKDLVKKHFSLRTYFEIIDGEVFQRVSEFTDIQVEYEYTSSEQSALLNAEKFIRSFNLDHAPLFRVKLIEVQTEYNLLLIDMHHIISDGVSIGILLNDLAVAYDGAQLKESKIQYVDYASWLHKQLDSDTFKNHETFWLSKLSGYNTVLDLPTDYIRPAVQSHDGDWMKFMLSSETCCKINQFCTENDITQYMLMIACFYVLLHRYSGQDDLVVGTITAGRDKIELEDIVGMFVNTLALRINCNDKMTFKQFITEVKSMILDSFQHQNYPFDKIVDKLKLHRDLSRNPLFDTMFMMQNINEMEFFLDGKKLIPFRIPNQISKFDLTMIVWPQNNEISFGIEFCPKIFKRSTIDRLGHHYEKIINSLITQSDMELFKIELATKIDLEVIQKANSTTIPKIINENVIQKIKKSADLFGDSSAIIYGKEQISYSELDKRSNQFSRYLRSKGAKHGSIIGIMVDRSVEMLIGMLGIIKAGGAYLPLDPDFPSDRLEYMLEDSGAEILVIHKRLTEKVSGYTGTKLLIESSRRLGSEAESDSSLEEEISREDLIYLMYTSGSTGKPKGTQINHGAVNNFIDGVADIIDFSPGKSILAVTTISFDISVLETLMALCCGMRVVIATKDQSLDPQQLGKLIEDQDVEMIQMTPSRIRMLASMEGSCLRNLKEILIGGETLPGDLLQQIKRLTNARIYNMYGPTETTIWSSVKEMTKEEHITIGSPIANTQFHIINTHGQMQPIGVWGELCISGAGLARGYHNRESLTLERFVNNPFCPGERMYRTGDIGRWIESGEVELKGRVDNQVKIRGYRIELGEIEEAIKGYNCIKDAVVIVREIAEREKTIAAYIVGTERIEIRAIREYLRDKLPEYMLPSYFVQLDKLPQTPNGKIDRKALPEPLLNNVSLKGNQYARTKNEKLIASIWKEILKIDSIDIDSNFFDLGGNSILAIMLSVKIKEQFKINFQATTIFQNPTIRELAGLLNRNEKEQWLHLVKLKHFPDCKKPLFCIHPVTGTVLCYADLARYMGNNQSVYALQAKGFEKGQVPHKNVKEMAEDYARQICNIQKDGPYFLCGWSAGGIIAWEIAQRLKSEGKRIGKLILLDTFPLVNVKTMSTMSLYVYGIKLALKHISELLKTLDVAELTMGGIYRRIKTVTKINTITQTYHCENFEGPVVLFQTEEHAKCARKYNKYSIEHLATEMQIQKVQGEHLLMVYEPVVIDLAEKIKKIIDEE